MQPEAEWVGVGGVDACGGRVGAQQLALRVPDQLSGVTATEALGGVLIHRRDVVALRRADDCAQGRRCACRRHRLLLPACPRAIYTSCEKTG